MMHVSTAIFVAAIVLMSFPYSVWGACPPGSVARGVYSKVCYPIAVRRSADGGNVGAAANVGGAIGNAVGGLVRDALFGTPEQQAAQQAAAEQQRQLEAAQRERLVSERIR